MTNPKISVIILTYNRAGLLQECITSVLDQNFEDYELLILDDGSTDDTLQILSSFKDSRLKFFTFQHSGHVAKLRNIGLQKSAGEYIAFLDSDDLWHKNHLFSQVNNLEEDTTIGYIFSDIEVYENQDLVHKGIY